MHSDLNNFYASVERKLHPELIGVPVAVCGNAEERKGIVLAKSEEAKRYKVKTGDTIWQAKKKCPNLVVVKPHFNEYMKYSRKAWEIYSTFTDLIEGYGIDECWLDVSKSTKIFPKFNGEMKIIENGIEYYTDEYLRFIGDTVRNAIKNQLGLTVSVGVSFNKVYAKLGSDLKKPDGTSVISYKNYKKIVNGLPVSDLLFVGKATQNKLEFMGYNTIGKLAAANDLKIHNALGKFGDTILSYARGLDTEEVRHMSEGRELKSIGNSQTFAEDLTNLNQVKKMLFVLTESVAARLREADLGKADTVHLWVRDSSLNGFTQQKKVRHTVLCGEIANHAYDLFCANFAPPFKIRALGVTVSGFDKGISQITLDETNGTYEKREKVERVVDEIRKKHGYSKLQRGIITDDIIEMHNDIKNSHLIKPGKFEGERFDEIEQSSQNDETDE